MSAIRIGLACALLAGCGATLPSPEQPVPGSNFQMRLGEIEGEVSGGTVGQSVSGFGAAAGCALTTLGTPPPDVRARLEADTCWAELRVAP